MKTVVYYDYKVIIKTFNKGLKNKINSENITRHISLNIRKTIIADCYFIILFKIYNSA